MSRVVVGVSGSLGNLSALHAAVDLARRADTRLLAVHVGSTEPDVLHRAFVDAFGEIPGDVDLLPVTGPYTPGPALTALASESTDVLVVGAGQRRSLHRLRVGPVARYCGRFARCAVVTVPPPALLSALPRARRRAVIAG